ncbi:hypothetical protein [Geminisphaera colitermitum]|uniref:hypothetical protein n=1 Tax=Geminisphaera colitermitum TaxID=1148786 RepID=UPI000158C676|nr:hypothetical protein [Geminisphaera colitermitum]
MNTQTIRCLLALTAGSISILAAPLGATSNELYKQTFDGFSAQTNKAITTISGWNAYAGATAGTATTSNVYIIGGYKGNPNGDYGFLAINSAGITTPYLAIGTITPINITDTTVTWTMGNASTGSKVQLMVQSGGEWYVSSGTYSNSSTYTAGTFASAETASVTQTLNFSTATWNAFALNPGTAMSVGATAALPSSSITGIGFYVTNASGLVRLDTLTVTSAAVPEPTAATLLLGTLALVAAAAACKLRR